MLAKRIIPCLDIKDGRTVKGVNFINLRDAGDPVELAIQYSKMGADELVFLDISATNEKRKTLAQLVRAIASKINIPFTVGGGIRSVEDVKILLDAGADKISINSAAVKRPLLIQELATNFGRQCVVLAVDTKYQKAEDDWFIYLNGGRKATGIRLFDWVQKGEALGAGEILLTSMDHDGTKAGFANALTARVSAHISIPVIASGGAGELIHFESIFKEGKADAALAASIFHFGEVSIPQLKTYLSNQNIPVRL